MLLIVGRPVPVNLSHLFSFRKSIVYRWTIYFEKDWRKERIHVKDVVILLMVQLKSIEIRNLVFGSFIFVGFWNLADISNVVNFMHNYVSALVSFIFFLDLVANLKLIVANKVAAIRCFHVSLQLFHFRVYQIIILQNHKIVSKSSSVVVSKRSHSYQL